MESEYPLSVMKRLLTLEALTFPLTVPCLISLPLKFQHQGEFDTLKSHMSKKKKKKNTQVESLWASLMGESPRTHLTWNFPWKCHVRMSEVIFPVEASGRIGNLFRFAAFTPSEGSESRELSWS